MTTKIIQDTELQEYLDKGWELVNTFANPNPQPMFYALVKEHEHKFIIPVEWYHRNNEELGGDYAPSAILLEEKRVTILRCECGDEINR